MLRECVHSPKIPRISIAYVTPFPPAPNCANSKVMLGGLFMQHSQGHRRRKYLTCTVWDTSSISAKLSFYMRSLFFYGKMTGSFWNIFLVKNKSKWALCLGARCIVTERQLDGIRWRPQRVERNLIRAIHGSDRIRSISHHPLRTSSSSSTWNVSKIFIFWLHYLLWNVIHRLVAWSLW